jgi:hypothetical protein
MCFAAATGLASASSALAQQDEPLARYFGFEPMRIVVGDDGFGPVIAADMNGDGRRDIVAANNSKSRIEIHYQRATMRTTSQTERVMKANELPPSPWYDRADVSVANRVAAVAVHDVDGDGKMDLVYAGVTPSELVVMRQTGGGAADADGGTVGGGTFEEFASRRVANLSARADGLIIADVMGDEREELLTLVESNVEVFPLGEDGQIGSPVRLGSSGKIVAAWVEDFNGDRLWDVMGAAPDDAAPIRLWMQRQDPRVSAKSGLLGAELRFEMPQINEAEPIRFPGRDAASIGVIERQTRRIVFLDVEHEPVEAPDAMTAAEREVQAEVTSFADDSRADRSIAVTDVDGDGMADLLATNAASNTIDLYRQAARVGLASREPFSAFKAPKVIAVGEWAVGGAESSPTPEVFVLSQEEKTVGVSFYDQKTGKLDFPTPLPLTVSGGQPEAMSYVTLDGGSGGGGTLAVVISKKRDQTLELHRVGENGADDVFPIELTGVNRTPQSILAADADQDGRSDLLLFTPGEPMVMVRSGDADAPGRPSQVLRDEDMPQFGLVQAAGPDNTAIFDIDGDGRQELLIADENFVRAVVYDGTLGWRVVDQISVADRGTKLVGLATGMAAGGSAVAGAGAGGGVLFASDKGNGRILGFARDADGGWRVTDRMRLMGFPLGPIQVGAFGGDGEPGLLCFGDDGFALVRLAGERAKLEPFAAYRSDEEGRREHDIEVGDLNGDGYLDAVVLDAGEQMCQIFTFSASRTLHLALEFEVFESRLFGRGSQSQFEPRSALIEDVTGDGRQDLILTVHDRLLIYPQMAK